MKFIGGFFELDLGFASRGPTTNLCLPTISTITFENGRSALCAWLQDTRAPKVWIPSYICPSVVEAVIHSDTPYGYYRVDSELQPDIAYLSKFVAPKEVVLAVDYFGSPPPRGFREWAATASEVTFVEDCSQALCTGADPWGGWRLFSPRKLLGVPDGGYMVCTFPETENRNHISQKKSNANSAFAALARFEDTDGTENLEWHRANQDREKSMGVSTRPMSRLSRAIISNLDLNLIARKRLENYHSLDRTLSGISFFQGKQIDFCPLGYPLRLSEHDRETLRATLISKGIFPTVHWENLPSPNDIFAESHQLSREILTLPCDQRYSRVEMELVAQVVTSHLGLRYDTAPVRN